MLKTIRGRLIIILAVIAVSVGYLYSNNARNGRPIKLGLDLQGGMHVALEVDDPDHTFTDSARADHIDRAERILRTRIDEFGVEEPLIQKVGSDRLVIELPGIDDEERAKRLIQSNAFLEWKLVLPTTRIQPSLARIDRAIVATLGEDSLRALGRAEEATPAETQSLENLLFGGGDSTGVADTTGADTLGAGAPAGDSVPPAAESAAETDTTQAQLPESNLRPFTALLNQGNAEGTYLVAEQDVPVAKEFLALPEVQVAIPRDVSLQWGADPEGIGARTYRRLYVLERQAFLTGDMLENAVANRDPQYNQPLVNFQLNRRGGVRFRDFSGQHIGDFLAIVLDGEVMSAPVIRDRIGASGQIELTNNAPMEEARDLALVLRAGALSAPLTIVEERTVGDDGGGGGAGSSGGHHARVLPDGGPARPGGPYRVRHHGVGRARCLRRHTDGTGHSGAHPLRGDGGRRQRPHLRKDPGGDRCR